MREFDSSAYERWCNQKEWDAEGHDGYCNCDTCHKYHYDHGMVADNAEMPDFQCCKDQMEEWFESGRRCRKHPRAYAEEPCAANSFTAYCEACEGEGER